MYQVTIQEHMYSKHNIKHMKSCQHLGLMLWLSTYFFSKREVINKKHFDSWVTDSGHRGMSAAGL